MLMRRWERRNGPVVSVVVTRPLMVCVSPVKGLVAVPLHVVVRVMVCVWVGWVALTRVGMYLLV